MPLELISACLFYFDTRDASNTKTKSYERTNLKSPSSFPFSTAKIGKELEIKTHVETTSLPRRARKTEIILIPQVE